MVLSSLDGGLFILDYKSVIFLRRLFTTTRNLENIFFLAEIPASATQLKFTSVDKCFPILYWSCW